MKANSKRTRHCRWPASLSAYDKGSINSQWKINTIWGWRRGIGAQDTLQRLDRPHRDQINLNWTVSPASMDMMLAYFR
jgi:hypothetical protein